MIDIIAVTSDGDAAAVAAVLAPGTGRLHGAIKLPDNRVFALHKGARHWADTLSRIRREVVPDAASSAQIDDSVSV